MDHAPITRISAVATRSQHEKVGVIDWPLVRRKAADARESARGREIHALHADDDDTLHRMLNAIQPGSYVAPHRHLDPPKAESLLLVQGELGLIVFDDEGAPDESNFVWLSPTSGVLGADCRAGVWHTIVALEPDTVIFEVKPGPYRAASDKDFAPWAPREGDPDAAAYLAELVTHFRRWIERQA
ncbi:MAG: WbuC family cupin fold metalloprotein [Planctomycetota bacterium]|jgi:cupin fold WbuC family metalloprotein